MARQDAERRVQLNRLIAEEAAGRKLMDILCCDCEEFFLAPVVSRKRCLPCSRKREADYQRAYHARRVGA